MGKIYRLTYDVPDKDADAEEGDRYGPISRTYLHKSSLARKLSQLNLGGGRALKLEEADLGPWRTLREPEAILRP